MDRVGDHDVAAVLIAEHARLMTKMTIHGARLSVQVERLERFVETQVNSYAGDDDE